MENKEEHNGWTNRETWVFHLHLTSNFYWQKRWEKMAHIMTCPQLTKRLEEYISKIYELTIFKCDTSKDEQNMIADIGSWWRINFKEVAEAFKGSD